MKLNLLLIAAILGIGALTIMFNTRPKEELVTESAPVSSLSFDEKIAKTPYETATFGMG
jgi:hypothetical protein